jgi:hypothetical protein
MAIAVEQSGTSANGQPATERERVLRAAEWRTTRFSDVCGGTDELKRLVVEDTTAAATPEGRAAVQGLVDDGLYMLARMEERLREYQAFRDNLARLVEQMRVIPEPRLADAAREAAAMRQHLQHLDSATAPLDVAGLVRRAEEIRQVANDMEGALRRHKEAAIAAGSAYVALRGRRGWNDGIAGLTSPPAPAASAVADSRDPRAPSGQARAGAPAQAAAPASAGSGEGPGGAQPLPPGVPEAWLPPSPHREQIVDWLVRGRAALLADEEVAKLPVGPQGREPWVQFEDGGVMPLRVVRWDDAVRNFHPLGQDPHPRGRLYRGRNAGVPPSAAPAA